MKVVKEIQKPVVQRLLKLIDFRNDYPAFNGEFVVEDTKNDKIKLTWNKDDKYCTLNIDLNTFESVIEYIDENGKVSLYNI